MLVVKVLHGYLDAGTLQEESLEENAFGSILSLPYSDLNMLAPYLKAQSEHSVYVPLKSLGRQKVEFVLQKINPADGEQVDSSHTRISCARDVVSPDKRICNGGPGLGCSVAECIGGVPTLQVDGALE